MNSDLVEQLAGLVSEQENHRTTNIDRLSTLDLVSSINQQDQTVADAVKAILPQIAKAVDLIVESINQGGRLVYIGAGTSGRLGVLDAVECVPTFSIDEGIVIGLMAGGQSAMFKAKEGIEDQPEEGQKALNEINLNSKDIVIGIAASGRTPYVLGAIDYANQIGATSVALSCNPNAKLAKNVDVALLPIVGAEVLAGSTRLKSGTAQKLVLNMLSTASMVKLGKCYKNLMVDLKATNEKLVARGTRLIMDITGVTQEIAEQKLVQANNQVKLALVMIIKKVDSEKAKQLLRESGGFLAKVLD